MAVALGPQCLGTTTHNAIWSNAIGLGRVLIDKKNILMIIIINPYVKYLFRS